MNNRQTTFKPVLYKIFHKHMTNTIPNIKGLGLLVMASLLLGAMPDLALAETVQVPISGNSYDIEYAGTNITIIDTEVDEDFKSLIFSVNVSDDDVLKVTLPRDVIDAKDKDGNDIEFVILADFDEPVSVETNNTPTSRTLSINLDAGVEEVEIIGTVLVQESIDEEIIEELVLEEEIIEELVLEEKICPDEYAPICGMDNKTYVNMCELGVAGIELKQSGECKADAPTKDAACGEGLVLIDDVCVIEDLSTNNSACGEGLVLIDDVCVIEESTAPIPVDAQQRSLPEGSKFELIYGAAAGFIVAFIVIIILAAMARASRSKD